MVILCFIFALWKKKKASISGKATDVNEIAQMELLYLTLRLTSSLCLYIDLTSIQNVKYLNGRKNIKTVVSPKDKRSAHSELWSKKEITNF